jgi:hypothetical protein
MYLLKVLSFWEEKIILVFFNALQVLVLNLSVYKTIHCFR